jgi:hypothetical protein
MLYVLTEKSNLYRINCETKTYELVKDEDSQIDEDEVR